MRISVSGKDWYGSETVYDPYGQVLRSTLGAQPYRVWTQNTFDESSGELKQQSVFREKPGDTSLVDQNPNNPWLVSDRSYTYDSSGNVTSVKEGSLGIEERQCFTYDPLGRLSCSGPSAGRASGAASGADRVTIDLPSVCFPGGR